MPLEIIIRREDAFHKYDIDALSVGDIVINGYHNPEKVPSNAGVYVVIADPAHLMSLHPAARQESLFVVNLRGGTAYTYSYMAKRTRHNGGVFRTTCSLNVSVNK